MSTGNGRVLGIKVVRKWSETYQWIPIFGAFVAFTTAFFTGANSLPVPFSTTVGSGALTLLQASIAACIISVPGTALSSNNKLDDLFSDFIKGNQPNEGFLMWSLVAVLITTTLWLALATYLELPVSSQQSMQSALFGTMLVVNGVHSPLRNKGKNEHFYSELLVILVEWMVVPVTAGVIAFCFFGFLKIVVLRDENAEKNILTFLPAFYGTSVGLLCLFLIYKVFPHPFKNIKQWETMLFVIMATFITALLSLIFVVLLIRKQTEVIVRKKSINSATTLPIGSLDQSPSKKSRDEEEEKFEEALKEYMEMRVLETVDEREEDEEQEQEQDKSGTYPATLPDSGQFPAELTPATLSSQSTPFKELLASTPNRLVQTTNFQRIPKLDKESIFSKLVRVIKNSSFTNSLEYDRHTLIRHALAEKFDEKMEAYLGFPQVLAACIFALIQCASEIAAVVSPIGAVLEIYKHRSRYSGNGEDVDQIHVELWIQVIGGLCASIGFFLFGWRLTKCLGGKLTYVSNSRGVVSQLCAIIAVTIATRMKLSVSSTYTLVGSILGVGIADDPKNVNWKLFLKFLGGWIGGILFCCGVASGIYSFTIYSPAYVVP